MKRSREGQRQPHLGPAAAAMRRGHVFRDARTATTQVTTERLLHDAVAMHRFHAPAQTRTARVLIANAEELALYRQRRRAEYEEKVTRGYRVLGNWLQYARWEATQGGDLARMRAVCERAVPLHGDNAVLWREYAELEQTHGQLQHARALWSRGVAAVPSSDDLWLKYLLCEQAAGEAARVRDVFERWLATPAVAPRGCVYVLYALYEVQHGDAQGVRAVLRRYVEADNSVEAWLLYSAVEQTVLRDAVRAVRVLETAAQALPDALLYGPHSCRVTLALAEAYMQRGDRARARALYATLLARTEQQPQQQQQSAEAARGHDSGSVGDDDGTRRAYDAIADAALAAQMRTERLYGDVDSSARVCAAHARRLYTSRLQRDPRDADARLSLCLLLRDELQHLQQQQCCDGDGDGRAAMRRVREELLLCLRAGMQLMPTPPRPRTKSSSNNNGSGDAEDVALTADEVRRAQQCAVFAMAYARLLCSGGGGDDDDDDAHMVDEEAGHRDNSDERQQQQVDEARRALAQCLRAFPFTQGECAQLWRDAAALEQRQGNIAQARKLLSAGAHVTHDATLLQARIALEEAAVRALQQEQQQQQQQEQRRVDDKSSSTVVVTAAVAEAMTRLREAYEAAIRADVHNTQWWFAFARAEDAAGQHARAVALYTACATTLAAAAARAPSMTARYALLTRVDGAWARCLATQARLLRRLTTATATADGNNDDDSSSSSDVDKRKARAAALQEMHSLLARLLRAVWDNYRDEALAWQAQQWRDASSNSDNNSSSNTTTTTASAAAASAPAPPTTLPDDVLGPAMARWGEAVDAAVRYALPHTRNATTTTTATAMRGSTASDGSVDKMTDTQRGALFMRNTFASMAARERTLLRRRISGVVTTDKSSSNAGDAEDEQQVAVAMAALGYDATQRIVAWAELLLSPLLQQWAKYEALHGGALEAVAAVAAAAPSVTSSSQQQSGVRRRRRLFASS